MLTFWLKNSTIRLTQLQPSETGRYQGSWVWDSYSFAVTRRGKGQRHRRHPYVFACTKTVDFHRLMTSIASCDPGTLGISSEGAIIPPLYPPSPEAGWQQGEP